MGTGRERQPAADGHEQRGAGAAASIGCVRLCFTGVRTGVYMSVCSGMCSCCVRGRVCACVYARACEDRCVDARRAPACAGLCDVCESAARMCGREARSGVCRFVCGSAARVHVNEGRERLAC